MKPQYVFLAVIVIILVLWAVVGQTTTAKQTIRVPWSAYTSGVCSYGGELATMEVKPYLKK